MSLHLAYHCFCGFAFSNDIFCSPISSLLISFCHLVSSFFAFTQIFLSWIRWGLLQSPFNLLIPIPDLSSYPLLVFSLLFFQLSSLPLFSSSPLFFPSVFSPPLIFPPFSSPFLFSVLYGQHVLLQFCCMSVEAHVLKLDSFRFFSRSGFLT